MKNEDYLLRRYSCNKFGVCQKMVLKTYNGQRNEISGVVWPLIFDTLTSKSKWVIYTPQGVLVRLNASVLWKSKIPSPSVHSGVSCKQWTTLPTVRGKYVLVLPTHSPIYIFSHLRDVYQSVKSVYYLSQTKDMVLNVQCTTY